MQTKITLVTLLAASSVPVFTAPVVFRSLGAELDTGLTVGGNLVDLGTGADVGDSVAGNLFHEFPEYDNQDHDLEHTETNYRRSACDTTYKNGGGAGYSPRPSKRNPVCVSYKKGGKTSGFEPTPSKRQHEHISREPKTKQSIGGGGGTSSGTVINYHKGVNEGSFIPFPSKRVLGVLFGTTAEISLGNMSKKGLVNGAGVPVTGGSIHEFTGNDNKERHHEHTARETGNKQGLSPGCAYGSHGPVPLGKQQVYTRQFDEPLGTPSDETIEGDDVNGKHEHIGLGTADLEEIESLIGGNSNVKREVSLNNLD